MKYLGSLFEPSKIAVIGASREEGKIGHIVFKNLLEGEKEVFPVNPNAEEIEGKKAFSSIKDIPKDIDLAVICVPAKIVPSILKEMGEKEVRNAIVISAGFSEAGNEELEEEIKEISKDKKINLLGPNSLGIAKKGMNATFFEGSTKEGNMAIISQSGALGVAMLDWLEKENIGVSSFVSIGNSARIGFNELIKYLEDDEQTKVICLYVESLKKGREFIETCKEGKKPVIAIKSGVTESGKKAARSHTAALATKEKIYDGAFKQAGVNKVRSIRSLFNGGRILSKYKVRGNKVMIVTNAGGPGVMAADAFERNNFDIVDIPSSVRKKLEDKLPSEASINNPLDIIGDAKPERYEKVLNILKDEGFFDFIFLILTPQSMTNATETARKVSNLDVPIFSSFIGGKKVEKAKEILESNEIINFEEPINGAEALKVIREEKG